ncbi:UDP-glucoronosyl and UDP-glucosyl transferase [Apiospora rasikravindrae]|uniref:UDP-glucoronosyl and UDP-glucosyl transferase n=1 Tax=Apiospora rasikravindrae TaxID=990691 RepID=A0ABR1TIB6_9PEZI
MKVELTPLFEISQILAERGYTIEFASFDGREDWIQNYPFISRYHPLGPALCAKKADALYLQEWNWSKCGWASKFESRKTLESTWPQVYQGLSELVQDAQSRPRLILSDFLVDASRDVSFEHSIPLAMHWPQMPTAMLNAPYIPGTPGLQVGILSSEYATIWQRFRNAFSIYPALPAYFRYFWWRENMRRKAGVSRVLPRLLKPDFLCLVNTMFGMEVPRDLPPHVAAVGPIISHQSRHLDEPYTSFLEKRARVLYISFGTHLALPWPIAQKLLLGALAVLGSGTIDGVIWPMKSAAREHLDLDGTVPVRHPQSHVVQRMSISDLLNGAHPSLLFVDRAPQQALLHDDRIVVFLSHVGTSSANEALYAGVPLISMALCFDQVQNEMRLQEAGVSIALNKDDFTADDVESAIRDIVEDKVTHGPIAANVRRMMAIARICSRRKVLAADLIEEVIVDAEGRKSEEMAKSRGVEGRTYRKGRTRHSHLQTADVRMPIWKSRNWDMWGVFLLAFSSLFGLVFGVSWPFMR